MKRIACAALLLLLSGIAKAQVAATINAQGATITGVDPAGAATAAVTNTQTAGTGGWAANVFLQVDTSNPGKYVTAAQLAVGGGCDAVSAAAVAAGSTGRIYTTGASSIQVYADGAIPSGNYVSLSNGGSTLGYASDTSISAANDGASQNISTTSKICGIARSTTTASGQLLTIDFLGPTSRGGKVDTINGTNLQNLGTGPAYLTAGVPSIATATNFYGANPLPVPAGGAEYDMVTTTGGGTQLLDISGNGNNATLGTGANAPTLYTYGVAFEDTGALSGYQTVSTPLTNWGTKYQLVCPPTLYATSGISTNTNPAAQFPTSWGNSVSGTGAGLLLINGFTGYTYSNAVTPTIFSAASSSVKTQLAGPYGGCHAYAYSLGVTANSTVDHIVVDGVEGTSYVAQVASSLLSNVTTTGSYQIGSGGSAAGNAWRGVVVYDITYPTGTTHTVAQMATGEAYMWARALARPTFPRYPLSTNAKTAQLVAVGDSLTATYAGTSQWSAAISTTNTYTVTNAGIYGQLGVDICSNASNRWMQYIVPGQTTLHFWAGTNDMYFGRTAAQTWLALSQCAQKANAAGARPIIATMISGSTRDAYKISLNALIRANWKQVGFAALDDIAEVANLGATSAYTNTACYNADQTHLTGPGAGTCATIGSTALTGYGIVAALASNVVNSLDGASAINPTVTTSNAYASTAADNFVSQAPTAAATFSLTDCQGRAVPQVITNSQSSAFNITVSGINSQTITGSATIAPLATATFVPLETGGISSTTGGCYWLRTQ